MMVYREALQKEGWSKLPKIDRDTEEGHLREALQMRHFCEVNNAEHAPDISNELITGFMEEVDTGIDRALAIDLTRNFCSWIYINGHTYSKLSMV